MKRRLLVAGLIAGSLLRRRQRPADLASHFADTGCVVTGGASGFGREITRRLAALGARILVVDRDLTGLEQLQAELPHIHTLAVDLTSPQAPSEVLAAALQHLGRVNLLFNNAGIAVSGPFVENTPAQIEAMTQINYVAHVQLTRAFLPALIAQGGGDLVFTASLSSWVSAPTLAVYSGTKAAIKQFAHALEREVATQGVRIFSLYPNVVRTNIMSNDVFDVVPMKYGISETVEALLQGLAKGQRDIFVNFEDRVFYRLEQAAPRLLSRLIARRPDVHAVMSMGMRDTNSLEHM
jgi:short-subunit dehydrogenase